RYPGRSDQRTRGRNRADRHPRFRQLGRAVYRWRYVSWTMPFQTFQFSDDLSVILDYLSNFIVRKVPFMPLANQYFGGLRFQAKCSTTASLDNDSLPELFCMNQCLKDRRSAWRGGK